jgi:conjugal transfer mating pair stabilization protein TraN
MSHPVEIPRHVDDPPTLLLWRIDDLALVVLMLVLVYTLAVILIQLIWTCEQDEFELGAKRDLKSCHCVGSYCKTKVLTVCIERRKAY